MGAPASLNGLPYTLVHCMPMAHEPQPGLHSCPDGHPGGGVASPLTTFTALNSQLPLQQQLLSLAQALLLRAAPASELLLLLLQLIRQIY